MCFTINEKNNTAELLLSKNFYHREAIEKASGLMEGIKIERKEENGYFHISMETSKRSGLKESALEFCNLVLAIMKGSAL